MKQKLNIGQLKISDIQMVSISRYVIPRGSVISIVSIPIFAYVCSKE